MPLVGQAPAGAPIPAPVPAAAPPAPPAWPAGNIFQASIDRAASPLISTPMPAPLQRLPMTPQTPGLGASIGNLPNLPGGLNLGGILKSLGGPLSPAAHPAALPVGGVQPTTAPAVGSTAPGWVQGVVRAAHQSGVDPNLAVAIALEESGGNPRAVGDQGTSFGLYQLHQGGALGSMNPQAAFDPYRNAMAVLPAWGKLGGGRGLSPAAGLMQYYHNVGRGSSDTIPVQHALAKLDQAKALVSGVGTGGGQTLMERTAAGTPGGGQLTQQAFGALLAYANRISTDALKGKAPDLNQVMQMVDPIMKAIMAPTGEVAAGNASPVAPPVTGRSGVATQAALSELGVPYSWGGGNLQGPTTGIQQGANIRGFDCSALVRFAWAKAGVLLPRTSEEQANVGQAVPNLGNAQPGDLLFPEPGHVMMYLGNGMAVESPHTGASVHTTSVAGRTFWRIRRPG
jgi:cell wall-associated NlpC family hydrolase